MQCKKLRMPTVAGIKKREGKWKNTGVQSASIFMILTKETPRATSRQAPPLKISLQTGNARLVARQNPSLKSQESKKFETLMHQSNLLQPITI